MREPKWSCALICSARPGDVARPFLSGLTAAVNHRLQISQSEILAINHVCGIVRAGGITIWDVRDFNHCSHSVCLGRCIFVSIYFSPAELYIFYYPKVFLFSDSFSFFYLCANCDCIHFTSACYGLLWNNNTSLKLLMFCEVLEMFKIWRRRCRELRFCLFYVGTEKGYLRRGGCLKHKGEGVIGGWRKLRSERLHNSYSSPEL